MAVRFAEVIGDPIAQSKSPIIHKHWLAQLGQEGDFFRTRVAADELAGFLDRRRSDPDWAGCNVTIPHKERIMQLLDRIDPAAHAIGAVNCAVPLAGQLTGFNTDIDGVAAALHPTDIDGRKVAVIGAGGGARAVIQYLVTRGAGEIVLLVRDPAKVAGKFAAEVLPLDRADEGLRRAVAIINASPLGMAGAATMPEWLLDSVARHAAGSTLFDMVTTPPTTPFLAAGRASADRLVDGLTMLIGQARRAFELFFGHPAPPDDAELRTLLTA